MKSNPVGEVAEVAGEVVKSGGRRLRETAYRLLACLIAGILIHGSISAALTVGAMLAMEAPRHAILPVSCSIGLGVGVFRALWSWRKPAQRQGVW